MKAYESIKEILSFYHVHCDKPYFISSGKLIFEFPKRLFRMDFYAFCICVSGSIDLEIDNQHYKISQNGFLISAPSTIIKFVNNSKDFRMKVLFFEKNFLLKNISNPFFIENLSLFNKNSFNVVISNESSSAHLINLLDYLQQQTTRNGRFTEDIVRTIIINILLEVAVLTDEDRKENAYPTPQDNNHIFFKFNELVKENILQHKDVQYYADKLFITNKYLILIVKKATGKTPHQIIDEALLKEVCVLLSYPEKNISQIAFETGFNSTSAFGRFFKKHASISPQRYRRQQHF
ncbi:AraC family transcriptional regulator [Epilithonimonas vandammei]|uniref:AraC family transcriptional regulator n=1 Tax=Epilithonimonas vandammei TaxID=2487072 RepID=A0A3G8ZAK1_9FLAO|nr:helix-turn-helix domain-containing protein [Epilithonimonas vandammei]AZI54449.1 AraC family transcriptional regulator [Epilithonimonas vandammei]